MGLTGGTNGVRSEVWGALDSEASRSSVAPGGVVRSAGGALCVGRGTMLVVWAGGVGRLCIDRSVCVMAARRVEGGMLSVVAIGPR